VYEYGKYLCTYEKVEGKTMDILKISAKSSPNSIAGAIAGLIKENGRAEMQAIGAGAINQAVKAVAIARGFVAPSGIELVCTPAFTEVTINNEEKTGIKFSVEPRL
jgi:stage V sporulation protein S